MRPYTVHEDEINAIKSLRQMPAKERRIVMAIIAEFESAKTPIKALPPNVLPLRRIAQ